VNIDNLFGFGPMDITICANDYIEKYKALMFGKIILDIQKINN